MTSRTHLKRILFFSLLVALASHASLLAAEDAAPISATTTKSNTYPEVTCTTTSLALSADVLQMAAETRRQLSRALNLGEEWRFPVNISIVTPDDPLAAKIHHQGVSVFAVNGTLKINAVVLSSDPDVREFIQRQFVIALLWEKFFAPNQSFDTQTRLDIVPVWLIEGLREGLNDDPEHDREAIVKRAALAKRAPSLDDVINWEEISNDRLMGLWQRAFCYYLVECLIRKDQQRANFQQWLSTVSGPHPTSARFLFPTEAGWQRELLAANGRSRDIYYSWDETAAELAAAESIAIPGTKVADTRICTLDTVFIFPRDKQLLAALQQKIFDLTALELRAHLSWRPIIALYRFGLTALLNKNQDEAKKYIVEAQRQRAAEMDNHQKLVDYVNWFEVTTDYPINTSHFSSYFFIAQELDKIEADPAHPEPTHTDPLKVESKL